MGHMAGKDVYRKLGEKIDNLTVKSPWNEALHRLLRELYTEQEADLVVQMPYLLSTVDRIARITGDDPGILQGRLAGLADKGLVLDLYHGGRYYYMPSPIMVGIFEFTMMRSCGNFDPGVAAGLFHAYLTGSGDFYRANAGDGQRIALARAVPYIDAVAPEDVVEILPYEKAEAIVDSHNRYAIGTCACRHEKLHSGYKKCSIPLDTCTSFSYAADYLIRHQMATKVSREQVLDNLARCKEMGLVFSADNVQHNITFICCCCACCCNLLRGINKFGYVGFIKTSSFIAVVNAEKCTGCGSCVAACPVKGIHLISAQVGEVTSCFATGPGSEEGAGRGKRLALVDESICLGCGVCAARCVHGALQLKKRRQRVLPPETTFERNILACLEKGTLPNYIFDDPGAVTHRVMRGILGGILKLPPVKKALVGDLFRSTFLNVLTTGVKLSGKGWITKL
ncbi:4Fe-4S binding protein [Desulfoscipio gibsoniae]|uniref:4Fe-4S protein n=1 Tax=Desulfoscipio gibsoniae DSM 7213 TaxID=767817 RepID=R4KJJ4_9FIRM|nr:4Fe-4S binding protein [Desulfoscipio gibsoniae]AGL03373.1 4Fe-4S protein [Desulfoscipio gibsoniae DSM 7213]